MKKVLVVIGKVLAWFGFILAEFILILFNGALWIRLDPPASAILTMPKLMYPNIANKAVWVYGIVLLAVLLPTILRRLKKLEIKRLHARKLIFISTLTLVLINSMVFIELIKNTKVEYTFETTFQTMAAAVNSSTTVKKTVTDLSDRTDLFGEKPLVFKLYLPDNSKKPRDIVIYLAYGNWLAVDEKTADYLIAPLLENDYGVGVLTGQTRRETDFVGIIKDIRMKVAYLRSHAEEYGIRRIILTGGSAGANIALTTALAYSCTQYDVQGRDPALFKVDGVIAFYPVVDMVYNYYYFTAKNPGEEGALDRLGDTIFSSQDVNKAKSIYESHQKVMNNLLGGFPDDPALKEAYRISSPTYLINSSSPPVLLIQGAHDSMTPIEPTREMFNKYEEMHLSAAILELPDTDHAFDVVFPEGSVIKQKVTESILSWLKALK